jgi:hypothetical protein
VRCGGCDERFELSVRNEYRARRDGRVPRCRDCRRPRVPPPVDAYTYWLSRFSLSEIEELAARIWPNAHRTLSSS